MIGCFNLSHDGFISSLAALCLATFGYRYYILVASLKKIRSGLRCNLVDAAATCCLLRAAYCLLPAACYLPLQ